jgi:TATA-box binding protein (TBP) (component of TFIID and TFIIIB)
MHSLSPEQARVGTLLKAAAVTHLIFSRGALGSTGNRSEDEARMATHELRLVLYYSLGMRTNFRRFAVSNMVCSSSLGYNIDLAKLHADFQTSSNYFPDLFPGLFFYYKYVFKDRVELHEAALAPDADPSEACGTGQRKVQLIENDLLQLHWNTSASARGSSEDAIRSEVKGLLETYLPRSKFLVVLVFVRGKTVGLGVCAFYSREATTRF